MRTSADYNPDALHREEQALRSRLENCGFTEIAVATAFREMGPVFFVQMIAPVPPEPPLELDSPVPFNHERLLQRIADTLDKIRAEAITPPPTIYGASMTGAAPFDLVGTLLKENRELRARLGEKGGGEREKGGGE